MTVPKRWAAYVNTGGQNRVSSDIRIVLLGRDVSSLDALRLLLSSRMNMSVIDCQSTAEYVELQNADEDESIIIVDADAFDADISGWLARLRHASHLLGVIVVGTRREMAPIVEEAGAEVFVAKEDPPLRLLSAVERLRTRGTDAQ